MSNGDSPDGFVFPPFVPPSAARPAPPPAVPASAAEPAPAPREPMPWDLEASDDTSEHAATAPLAEEAPAGDELPWLELPEPREAPASAAETAGAADAPGASGALPEWMTWDARAEAEAEAELAATEPVEGLEAYDAADSFTLGDGALADDFPYGGLDAGASREDTEAADLSTLELEDGFGAEGGFVVVEEEGFGAEAEQGATAAPAAPAGQGFAPDRFEDPFAEAFAAAPDAGPFVADDEAVMAAEPDPFTAAEIEHTGEEAPAEPAAAAANAGAPDAFVEVAARLEEIARTLRERPEEVLAGRGGDPLALLVTGYALGWLHGRGG